VEQDAITLEFQSTSFSRRKTDTKGKVQHRNCCFNPLPSHEGRRCFPVQDSPVILFQSTSFSRRKTSAPFRGYYRWHVSIHFLLTKEDDQDTHRMIHTDCFNPLPSHEGRLFWPCNIFCCVYVSIHFLLTKEDAEDRYSSQGLHVSIHFLLTKEDLLLQHLP